MFFLNYHLYSIVTEIYILFSICVLILFSVISSVNTNLGFPIITKNLFFFSLQIIIFSLIILINQTPIYFLSWQNFFISNTFTYYSKITILILFLVWALLVIDFNTQNNINKFEFWILILLNIIASFLLVQSCDLLSIYLAIEFQSLIFYILASFNRNSEFSTESGIKYFILGALSSALLLFGITMLYNLTGLSNLIDFSKFFIGDLIINSILYNEIFICLIFILISFLFKLSAAPFHSWAPDVYEGAPTSVTLFFAILPKLTTLCLIIKIVSLTSSQFVFNYSYIFTFSVLLSSLVGTFGAFYQTKWKRFITYSSISHISFFLLNFIYWDLFNFNCLFFYLLVYLIMTFAFFSFFINFQIISYPKQIQVRYLNNLQFINEINPLVGISIVLILFSMAGIPPLGGFFSKFIIFFSAIKNEIFGVVLILVILNCISCFYYLRIIKSIYFNKPPNLYSIFKPMCKLNSLILGLCTLILIILFKDLNFIFTCLSIITFPFIY